MLPARLREFAEKHFDSMADFARALDMPPQQIYDYLSGKSKPGALILMKLSELGCDINWLLTGKGRDSTEVQKKIEELEQENSRLRDELHRVLTAAQALETVTRAAEKKIPYIIKKKGVKE